MSDSLVVGAIVWVVCAVICGFLAPLKGRPATPWFIGGLVFGIFAVITLAILEPLDG